jgi:hypothetical protein
MINRLGAALILVSSSVLVGCGGGSDAHVVGSEEEYAEIRTSSEKEAEMNAKFNAGPSKADIKKMAEDAKRAATR